MVRSARIALEHARASFTARPDVWEASLLAALGIALTGIGLTGVWSALSPLSTDLGPWWHLAAILPACGALLAKRRHPLLVLGVVSGFFVGDLLLGGSLAMLLVFWDALYAAAYFGRPTTRTWLLRAIVVAIVAVTATAGFPEYDLRLTVLMALQAFAFIGTPYWWATAVRQKSELAELAEQRADDLARMAALRETQLVREERRRMARDLHDVIAGQLSAIAIHSEAALSHPESSTADRDALRAIRSTSVRSLEEMRSMIMLLRDGREPAETIGGLGRAAALFATARGTGLTVVDESPAGAALPELPAVVDQAAARILQEALTNAARHTRDGHAVIDLREVGGLLRVRVTSRGAPAASPTAAFSAHDGIGVLTMTERAAAVGGTLRAGWTDPDHLEWTVNAELPLGKAR